MSDHDSDAREGAVRRPRRQRPSSPPDQTASAIPMGGATAHREGTAADTYAWGGDDNPPTAAPLPTGGDATAAGPEPTAAGPDEGSAASSFQRGMLAQALEPEPPTIPGYTLLECLGRGGMGEVHLAERVTDTGVRMRCALKLVHPGRRDQALYTRQILSEAKIIAELRHPNIVHILDVGRTDEHVWMAMEWLDGCDARTLRNLARDRGGEIPLKHLVYLVRESLQGLHHAHEARSADGQPLGVVHRDISPGNILVSRHGAVKLADFGVAAATGVKSLRMAGKPGYLSPEIYQGAPASVQSDIFAMGVTLYELLSMRPLFGRNLSFQEFEARVLAFDAEALIEEDLTIPDGLEDVLLRSLAARPEDRYASALEMLEDVSDFAYEAGLRLLDAHFARYVERSLAAAGSPG